VGDINSYMIKQIFYNSSLPRSGSTLLQNILMQNPLIYSTPTSGVIDLLLGSRTIYTNNDAFRAQDPDVVKRGFLKYCHSGLYGYYNGITDRPYVFEKSRAWLGNWGFLSLFETNPKIVVMVRDLRGIFASMEKNWRKNQDKDPNITNALELKNMTTDSRLQHFSVSPPVGPTLEWLYEVFNQGYQNKILFIRYEDFLTNPVVQMNAIYDYIGIQRYNHDFDNIEQLTHENDVIHGIFGDHKIKNKIEPLKIDYFDILGEKNCNSIVNNYSWFYKNFNYSI
jgi:sulfotransferase